MLLIILSSPQIVLIGGRWDWLDYLLYRLLPVPAVSISINGGSGGERT